MAATLTLPQTLNSKWFSTAASIWIQSTSGSLYTFSVYSAALKSTQGYDQSTLDAVTVFKDIGANCGVLAGLLYSSSIASDRGPWMVLLAGAIQNFAGYFLIWAAVAGLIPPPPVPVMCLFVILAAHAQTFFNTANVVTSVRNFRQYSGTAVGIMKGFLGLSGAMLVQFYQTVFDNKPESFLLMLAILPSVNTLMLMWFVRIFDVHEQDEKKHLDGFSLIALIIAGYLLCIIILENVVNFQLVFFRAIAFALLLLLLASPAVVTVRAQQREDDSLAVPMQDDYRLLPREEEDGVGNHECISQPELTLVQAIGKVDFWILFLAMACGMGSGLATVNNLAQVGQSLGYTSHETNTLVSLWSIWNFLGRFGGGYISDYFLHSRGCARPLFMLITLLGMSLGHGAIASGFRGALYAGSVVIGVCYGSQWSLMPSIASEIFGVEHMGTIFNTITVACPVGSYVFSVRVIGFIYDKEASGELNLCTGTHCFVMAFVIMSCATFLGSLAALWLFLRTRLFYSRVILRRLQASFRK